MKLRVNQGFRPVIGSLSGERTRVFQNGMSVLENCYSYCINYSKWKEVFSSKNTMWQLNVIC